MYHRLPVLKCNNKNYSCQKEILHTKGDKVHTGPNIYLGLLFTRVAHFHMVPCDYLILGHFHHAVKASISIDQY